MKILLIIFGLLFLISCTNKDTNKITAISDDESIENNQKPVTDSLMNKIEADLIYEYSILTDLRFNTNSIDFDSIEKQSLKFTQKIIDYTSKYPQTLLYEFDSLNQNQVSIITSKDSLFRIYSWNTWLGGTMEDYSAIVQYKTENDKVLTRLYNDSTGLVYIPYYSEIFSLKSKNKLFYLAIENKKYSTRDVGEGIRAFKIDKDILNDSVQLFETSYGLNNELCFEYDFFSFADNPERPIELIRYDSAKLEIHLPIINSGEVTNQFKTYKFNGEYFEEQTPAANRVGCPVR